MPFIEVPTWDNGKWTTTVFDTKEEYREFVKSCFKEPGKYEFDETSLLFNAEATKFNETGVYCTFPNRSKDYVNYWDTHKERAKKGVIFRKGGKVWYLTRFYYFWINFLKIYNKQKKNFEFPDIRDIQYHMALYELLAELHGKHGAIVKKRQMASSYFHCARLINRFWFDEGAVMKMGASLKDYINDKGSWKYLNEYRNFLNENTAWYRPLDPDKVLSWQQRIKVRSGGRDTFRGLRSVLTGMSFEKDPTSGVGGPCHRLGTLILMADGKHKKVEDISVGEYVLGIDNKPKKVLKKFSGEDYIYEVKQSRGNAYYTTGEHILYLINRDKKVSEKSKERLTKTKDWNDLTTYRKRCYVGVKNNKPLEFFNNYTTPTLDPYFLGLWLGDGYRAVPGLIVNKTKDIEVYDYVNNLAKLTETPINCRRKEANRYNDEMYSCIYPISIEYKDTHFTSQFIKYNLFYNKHIPNEFLYGSVETRLQVLAGIIDTDGYFDPSHGQFEICCKNDLLFEQIVFLSCSLGAIVRTGKQSSEEHIVNNRPIKFTETNRASIYFQDPSIIPTKIARKQGTFIRQRHNHTSPIVSVTQLGIEPYAGIQVEDSLYYLEDLTITHNCDEMFYEEAGIAPNLDQTYIYMRQAMRDGMITTGLFIAAGSVGDLDDCDPLKDFMLNPEDNDIYAIDTTLTDEHGTPSKSALFLPEQWSMAPYIDQYGNSMVEEAMVALNAEFAELKKKLTPEKYQLEISQRPRNISEAFASRKVSVFPPHLLAAQLKRIEDKTYPVECVDLIKDQTGKISVKAVNKSPIKEFPISKKTEDKTGVICIYERPIPKAPWGTYYASIDPVGEGKVTTSESLCSIYVYKNATEVIKDDGNGEVTSYIEPETMVASWCGRFDDLQKTHERLELIIEYYNAWTIVENNISLFIQYMISKRKQKYLVPKSMILFLKELGANNNVYQEYGWKNTGNLFKAHLLSYGIQSVQEEISVDTDPSGKVIYTKYGVENIKDPMLLVEMQQYQDGLNVDRLVTYCALMAFMQVQRSNRGIAKRVEVTNDTLENSGNLSNLYRGRSPFNRIGKSNLQGLPGMKRNPFRNLR